MGKVSVGVAFMLGWCLMGDAMAGEIQVKNIPNDAPSFKREYKKALTNGRTITIKMRRGVFGGRYSNAQIRQENGSWVTFDVERIADKILDRQLVPLVQDAVKEILRMDADFIKSNPSEFVDETGQRWLKQVPQ
jgi:hypothetical protein